MTTKEVTSNSSVIHDGATANDLKYIFGLSYAAVRYKISGIRPCGKRGANDIYKIKDVAPLLCKVDYQDDAVMVERILNMNADELPVKLSKAFWDGKRSRQQFEKEEGDLWPTDQVVELAGEAFKTIRLSLLLMPDTLERESSLSERQREVVQSIVDATLLQMKARLIDAFNDRREHEISEPEASGKREPDTEGL